jgi:hypothetical protein
MLPLHGCSIWIFQSVFNAYAPVEFIAPNEKRRPDVGGLARRVR